MALTSSSGPSPPDTSRASAVLIFNWLTASIALLLVSLRFYIRGILRKNLGWDDYTSFLAIALVIAQNILSIFQVKSGFGRNTQYLTPVQLKRFGLYTDICIMLFIVITALIRASVCLFLHRVVPPSKMSYRRWIWGLGIFCTIVSLANFLAQCLQCIPLPGLWDRNVDARCIARADMTRIAKFQGGSAVVTDFLCVALPMLVFRNLQVNLRDKLAIYIFLGLGFFPAATAIVRTSLVDFSTNNPTWDLILVAIWACLEQNIGIIVASMPALRQLVVIRKRPFQTRSSDAFRNDRYVSTRPPVNPFAKLSDSDQIHLHHDDPCTEPGSRELSPLRVKTSSFDNKYPDTSASPTRLSMVPPPLWTDRKISVAETVQLSRVCPTPTLVEHNASAEKVRSSMVAPSWGHRKTSSAGTAADTRRYGRPSMVSPLSLDRPPFPAGTSSRQQLGKFEETGLRHSRIATTSEEMVSFGNPWAMGYSCRIEGGTPKTTPKASPKLGPW